MTRAWAIAAVLGTSAPALADTPATTVGNGDVVAPDHPITVTVPGERSANDLELIGGMAGVGLLVTGLGVFYHLDSRSTSNTISAEAPTSLPWTDADQAQYDHAHSLAVHAGICYGIGGAILIGALIGWIATAPEDQHVVIRPHVTPTVAPTPGGAMLGGSWRF